MRESTLSARTCKVLMLDTNQRETGLTESLSNKDTDHKTLTGRENTEMSKLFKVMLSQ